MIRMYTFPSTGRSRAFCRNLPQMRRLIVAIHLPPTAPKRRMGLGHRSLLDGVSRGPDQAVGPSFATPLGNVY